MAQKINSKQLKEIYFNSPSPARSFYEPIKYGKMKKTNHSFLNSDKYYQKYSEDEISRFESFFNKHYYHTNTETNVPIFKKQEKIDFSNKFEQGKACNFRTETPIKTPICHPQPDPSIPRKIYPHDVTKPVGFLEKSIAPPVEAKKGLPLSPLKKDLIEQRSINGKVSAKDFDLETSELEMPLKTLVTPAESILFSESKRDEFFITKEDEAVDDDKVFTEDIAHLNDDKRLSKENIVKDTIKSKLAFNENKISNKMFDEDLLYLENLVSSGGNGMNTTSLDSIGNLLDEIVDNEKNQISNYQTDVFNANIQLLFNADPEEDLPLPPPLPAFPLTQHKPSAIQNNKEINDNAMSTPLKIDEEGMKAKVESNTETNPIRKPHFEKKLQDDFSNFIPAVQIKSKKPKLNVIDTILVISLLVVVSILLFYFRDLLPFEFPF